MRDLEEVKVEKAIVHLVAPRQKRLVLSERELPADDQVFGFLAAHVKGGLHDPQAKAVRFIVLGDERVSGLCDSLLVAPENLVEISQGLARRLEDVTTTDKRISDGALAVVICKATHDGSDIRFVGILKLDPSDAFRPVEGTDEEGKRFVRLELEPNILPSKRERLQKAAFVRGEIPDQEYRVLALDRQTTAEPAVFFVSKYLGAEFVLDAEERTARLYRSLVGARNAAEPELTAAQLVALDRVISGTMASASVNLDEVVSALPVPEPVRQQIDERVSAALPDREFDLDTGLASKLVRKRRFQADNGLRLIVPAVFYEQMVKVEDIPDTDPTVRRVVIETHKWQEI